MLIAPLLVALALFQDSGTEGKEEPATEQEAGYKVDRYFVPRGNNPRLFLDVRRVSMDPMTPMLVLYHRASSSKGEYRPMFPRLRELGYNAMAVDLSSGGMSREVKNMTRQNARDHGLNPTFLDSLTDIQDSLIHARTDLAHGKIIAWGSGFSAALVLHEASVRPDLVDGVISFSPADSFAFLGKSPTWIQESVRTVECPVFITSARSEEADWMPIFTAVASKAKVSFLPTGKGTSGSPALWQECTESAEYWTALEGFLKANFPIAPAPAPEKTPKGG